MSLKEISRWKLLVVWIFFIILLLFAIGPLFLKILESAFIGESFGYLNNLIDRHRLKNPDVRTIEYYSKEGINYLNRIALMGIYIGLSLFLISINNFKPLKEFYQERSHPVNLSVLRIIIFSSVLFANFYALAISSHALGSGSLIPPFGWDLIEFFPYPSELLVRIIGTIFLISNIFAALGISTRTSIIVATISSFFVLGIPQMFGKINHYHILWHIMLLLCFTNSADYFSVDRLLFKKKTKERSGLETSIIINSIIVLIGITYFFPGFWKFVLSGIEWALSDNLKYKLHSKWIELDGWQPFLRLDRYPFLYKSAALFTLLFELSFLFAIFNRRARYCVVLIGLGFHFMVLVTMKIFFWPIMVLYLVFIDWSKPLGLKNLSYDSSITLRKFFKTSSSKVVVVLFSFNIFAGFLLIDSWPFAVNPTFASIENDSITTLSIEVDTDNGYEIIVPLVSNEIFLNDFPSTPRFRGFLESTMITSDSSNFQILANLAFKEYKNSKSATFYRSQISTDPDQSYRILERGIELYEISRE